MNFKYTSKFITFLTLSVIIHLLILILNLTNEEKQNKEEATKSQNNLINFEVIYPPDNNSSTLETYEDKGLNSIFSEGCKDGTWYGGIGVKVATETDSTVLAVFEGYPAEAAGILEGDVLTSLNDGQIKGEPGTLALIQIERNGLVHTKPIIREKICYGN